MKKRSVRIALLVTAFMLGLGLMLYPIISNWLSKRIAVETSLTYEQAASSLSEEERAKEWEKAKAYNDSLKGDPVRDPFVPGSGRALPQNYLDVLAIEPAMSVIKIPAIDVELPVYHGSSDEVLQKGVGHLENSAVPIGGEGNHTVLTGHTGLPSAKMFTDLIDLKKGDQFYIDVLGEELIYEVDQIKVVEPKDISSLVPVEGKDYMTLVTCTPYGVNSHRLLVRGERTYQLSQSVNIVETKYILYQVIFVISLLCTVGTLIVLVRGRRE